MNKMVEETVKNMMRPGERTGKDYIGEDGLLYCGQCHEPKEAYFDQEKIGVLGIKKHPRECECRRQKRKEEEQYREQQRHEAVVRELKEHCFSDRSMKEWTFENDKGLSENTVLAKLYVKDWETMKAENTGYLFWGAVGTGKSFLAGCIANALLEQEIEVRMNNFAEVLNDLSANFSEKNTYIKNLCRVPLLILDDFGMERGTEYGLEQIYAVIDGRYRSGKPLIATTNLTLQELKNPQDTAHARIYDRLLEMCVPVHFKGESFRKRTAQEKLGRMQKRIKEEMR